MTVLLDNAFKYSPAGGTVLAALTSERRGVRFTVENTAAGVTQDQLAHFSERFLPR